MLERWPQAARRDVIALMVASFAIVVVLTVTLVGRQSAPGGGGYQLGDVLAIAIVAGAVVGFGGLLWFVVWAMRAALERTNGELSTVRRNLATAEAILKAEPQVLFYWEEGQELRIVTHTLQKVPGLPKEGSELQRFGTWLEPRSAEDLRAGLDQLFATGRAFNIILRTIADGHLEADGRASGTRAVLRLRDMAGYKQDLIRILEQHRLLNRDIAASRALLDALPMPVWLRSAEGRIEWANSAYARAVEAGEPREVAARQIELLDSRQRSDVEATARARETFNRRLQLMIRGEHRPHDVIVIPIEQATAGVAIDVAALEKAQGELDRQTAAYDRTLDRVATAVAIFGREQKLVFYNEAYRKLWDLDQAWLDAAPKDGDILDHLRELDRLPPMKDYRGWKSKLLACYRSTKVIEDFWHLRDGRTVHVLAEQRPDGGVTHLYDDVTEKLALESRYNELFSVQRETLDSLTEGVAVFGTDGRLKLFNTSLLRIWRISKAEAESGPHVSNFIMQVRPLYDDERTWMKIRRVVTAITEDREMVEGQMLRPDGSVIEFAAAPLPDGATLVTFADVSASKRYERALEERNEALIAADRLKTQFISHVSYELRTPLTNIIGFSELLASPHAGDLNGKQVEYLGDIQASSKTLLSIVDDILDLATIDAGGFELRSGPVDVRAVIEAAVAGVGDRAGRSRITIDIAIADDALRFVADEGRVRQVLHNLLSNAIGFSNPGGVVAISAWRERGFMHFQIEDHGVGIPRDQQSRIFERFVSRTQGSKHRGVGLGLSIVRSLVELHGGAIELDSEPGRGTRVTVRLPEHGGPGRSVSADSGRISGRA